MITTSMQVRAFLALFSNIRMKLLLLGLVLCWIAGCQSLPLTPSWPQTQAFANEVSLHLAAGDVLQITFPGATNLNLTQPIRWDGKISLQLKGELLASGKTPEQLQQEILALYETDLRVKEVLVTASAVFKVYVGGAVLRQGPVISQRKLTALEAVMEAGGFDPARAKMSRVSVTRIEQDRYRTFVLDLESVLNGRQTQLFHLEPNDVVWVPQKRVLF